MKEILEGKEGTRDKGVTYSWRFKDNADCWLKILALKQDFRGIFNYDSTVTMYFKPVSLRLGFVDPCGSASEQFHSYFFDAILLQVLNFFHHIFYSHTWIKRWINYTFELFYILFNQNLWDNSDEKVHGTKEVEEHFCKP